MNFEAQNVMMTFLNVNSFSLAHFVYADGLR